MGPKSGRRPGGSSTSRPSDARAHFEGPAGVLVAGGGAARLLISGGYRPALSGDGRFVVAEVAYASYAADLTTRPPPGIRVYSSSIGGDRARHLGQAGAEAAAVLSPTAARSRREGGGGQRAVRGARGRA